jgi:diguanylate cyclase (GGDEF)-like protein
VHIEEYIKRFFIYLESKSRLVNFCIGLVCALAVVVLDVIDQQEYQFAFLYLFPVGLTTWYAGRCYGIFIALFCSFAWVIDNHTHYSVSLVWNTISTIGIFLIISMLVHRVRIMWENERRHSRHDFLTGFLNTRAFQEIMEYEINRLSRVGKPLTIAYIDLDNFKEINDKFGHIRGDELLKCFATSLAGRLRKTDLVARIGGDEFVILLPETNQESAQVALHKIKDNLLHDMKKEHWSTTFSVGAVTCLAPPLDSEELINMADELMYKVKQDGKNSIMFTVFPPVGIV